jgi:hypothetical protein
MADKNFYPSFTYGFARVYMEFNIKAKGNTAWLIADMDGVDQSCISSIARTGVGVQVIVLGARDRYNKVIYKTADADDTAGDGSYVTVGNVVNEASATLGIGFTARCWTAGGAASDIGSGGSPRIVNFQFAFRNTASGLK